MEVIFLDKSQQKEKKINIIKKNKFGQYFTNL